MYVLFVCAKVYCGLHTLNQSQDMSVRNHQISGWPNSVVIDYK